MSRIDADILESVRGVARARKASRADVRWSNDAVLRLLEHIEALESELRGLHLLDAADVMRETTQDDAHRAPRGT